MSAFSNGRKHLDQGDFDLAVASFREAHDLWPENKQYFQAWCRATEKAIEWHRKEASAKFNERMLELALSHVDQAMRYCDPGAEPIPGRPSKECRTACGVPKGPPHHPHTLRGAINVNEQELAELRALVQSAIDEAARLRDTGEAQMAAGAWDEAVVTLRQASELDRSSDRAKNLLERAVDGAVKYHLVLATEHLHAESWDACRRECEVASSYRPGQPEIQGLRKTADDRQKARGLQSQASQAVQEREHLRAVQLLEEAVPLWPEDPSISAALLEAKNLAADELLVEARSQLALHAYSVAVRLLDKAKALLPDRSDILATLAEAETAWSESLLSEARDLFARGANELAWVRAARACGVSAEHLLAQQDLDRYAASIRNELRCAIAVVPTSDGQAVPKETLRACEMVTTGLKAHAPSHLHVLERSRLAEVLAEHELARTDLLDSAALARLSSRLSNADLLLFMSTTRRTSDRQEVERWDSVTYIAGTKLVPNPAYAQAQAAVAQAHQQLQDARTAQLGLSLFGGLLGVTGKLGAELLGAGMRGAGGVGAQQASDTYNAAVAQLNQTPQMTPVPDERVYRFPVCRITRSATITCSLRLVDVATGEVLWNEDGLSHTVAQSDTYVKPEPEYGVPGKYALLSDPEQLYSEACEGLQDELRSACQELLCCRSAAYLARARSVSDPAEAVAHRVHYLFDPGPKPDAEAVRDAMAAVFDGDLDPVRGDRGRVFVMERLGLHPVDASRLTASASDHVPAAAEPQQLMGAEPIQQASHASEAVRITLYDKRKRDKQEAFGLIFDVDDVSKDGVDIRVSAPGTKGPKFEDYRVGSEFDAYHVHVRIIECEPKYGRAVIDVWENQWTRGPRPEPR